ncbi:MAG: hypothetical protein KJ043_05320 [Anaerolineae bacterium]|nr:hypothetical protein [Anaerolineae bacterium]
MTQKYTLPYGWMILFILTLIAYTLPWVIGESASLTFGAFDLAEWASLHPANRALSLTLLTSFLLRMPLVCLAWIIAFNAPPYPFKSASWWIHTLLCLILVILSTPPLEFLTIFRDDVNYIQQASLTLVAGVGCAIGLGGIFKKYRVYIAILAGIIGIITSIWGVINGYTLLSDFQINVSVGIGIIISVVMFVIMCGYGWRESKRRR